MPYKTIQQNFANGELNPKMQGRTDVDMYYKSAQKMRNVATTPYGGFVRRPGSVNLYRGADGLRKIDTLSATTQLTEDADHPVSNVLDGNKDTYFKGQSELLQAGNALVSITDNLSVATEKKYYAYTSYKDVLYAFVFVSGEGEGLPRVFSKKRYPQSTSDLLYENQGTLKPLTDKFSPAKFSSYDKENNSLTLMRLYPLGGDMGEAVYLYNTEQSRLNEPYTAYLTEEYPVKGDSIYSDTNETVLGTIDFIDGNVLTSEIGDFTRNADADITVEETVETEYKNAKQINIFGISSSQEQELSIYANGSEEVATIKVNSEKQDLFLACDVPSLSSISIISKKEGNFDIEIADIEIYYGETKSVVRLLPFVFNNSESYVLSITNQTIRIFSNDRLIEQISAPEFTYDIIKTLRYAQTADSAIFVHPDLRPMILVRDSVANTWVLKRIDFDSIPYYNFEGKSVSTGKATLTPNALDGTVKLTLSEEVQENLVGQYIDGNGGRVKITSQSGKTLNGYTIIGFYTTDTISAGAWTYTTDYEPVWSDTRGWPCSVTFHQGRLWFGGSKSRPQTVWGSKVGLFYKFDPTAGYDNDAIEFTLDTDSLNKITDIYSAKGLYIFTLGGEFVCQTSYGEPITPKNVSALKQSSNGSWENTQPVELEGSVIFVERKGQALMNFAYLTEEDYATSNASLVNSHLINQPEDLDVERNNLTQQTNYVYIVNKDGTMCVVNLLAAQGISGGFTLWKTEGEIKSVCVLPEATYIAVERRENTDSPIYIEKLEWNNLTDSAEVISLSGEKQYSVSRFAGKIVDVICDGKFVGEYKGDENGLISFGKGLTGKVEIGLPFRSYVQSNFLEVAQMGSGVGKLKRLASMVVRVLDTPEVTINGETQKGTGKGVEDIHFYGIGDWDEKPTWEFTQNTPYKFNVLAAQMDLNYQLSTESY